jgi:large subunit ribosomal protein L19
MTVQDLIQSIEAQHLKADLPLLLPGDTVRVAVRIVEGAKERIQAYEGVVLRVRGGGLNKTFTVRKVFQGVGIERCFLLNSPRLESVKVLRRGKVRQARLYYLRDLSGKAARIKERTTGLVAPGKPGSLIITKAAKAAAKAEAQAAAVLASAPKAAAPVAEAEAE